MRSTIYVILAVLLLGGGFALYMANQGTIAKLPGSQSALTPLKLDPKGSHYGNSGPGDRPWMKQIDHDGRLASQFRAKEYQPRSDGTTVHVKGVQADFFQYPKDSKTSVQRVQRIRMEGREGDVEMPESNRDENASPLGGDKTPTAQPKRGRLNDVVMHVFPDDRNPDPAKRRETITLHTNNLAFDNETFEVTTEAIKDKDGNILVARDEVPIHVTGDYEFEGRGLKLRWNDVDGRLELLEVAHGDFLQINHPGDMTSPDHKNSGAAGQSAAMMPDPGVGFASDPLDDDSGPLRNDAGQPIMFAAKGKKPPARAIKAATDPATTQPKPHPPQPPYRATFFDDVHVSQGERMVKEEELATGDLMHVDFRTGSSGSPTTNPSTRPTTRVALANAPATAPSVVPTPGDVRVEPSTNPALAENIAPATRPETQPTTRPAEKPIIVRWNGMLRIVPIEPGAPELPMGLKAGESVLHMIGTKAPVLLTRQQVSDEGVLERIDRARCASADYFSSTGSAFLHNSPQYPLVTVTQTTAPTSARQQASAQDTTIVSEDSIIYSGTDHVAHLNGRGHAHMLTKETGSTKPAGTPPDVVDAKWSKSAVITFGSADHSTTQPTTRPQKSSDGGLVIQHATLRGDVDVKHPSLSQKSDVLDLAFDTMPTTRPTSRPSQEVADALPFNALSTTEPSTRPTGHHDKPDQSSSLRQMVATGNVWCELKDKDKDKIQTVTGDTLTVDMDRSDDDKPYPHVVDVVGNAHASDPTQDIQAKHIHATLAPLKKEMATTQPALALASGAGEPSTRPTDSAGSDMPAIELQTMTALDGVRVTKADGSLATGDELYVVMYERQPHVRLIGRPDAQVVNYKKDVLIGPVIIIDQQKGVDTARVEGPGRMQMMQQGENPQDRPRPIDVKWTIGAFVNGPENWVDVYGPVNVITPDADGTIKTADSKRMRIELADKPPATQPGQPSPRATATATAHGPSYGSAAQLPTAQTASARTPAVTASVLPVAHGPSAMPTTAPVIDAKAHSKSKDSSAGTDENAGFMANKVPTAIVLHEDAVVKSSLTGSDGAIIQESQLTAAVVRYELGDDSVKAAPGVTIDPNGPGHKKLIVPGSGKMIVRDHRPQAAKDPNKPDSDPGGSRGATAFQWTKDLIYDQTTQRAVFNGDVIVVHKDDQPTSPSLRLTAVQVVADFEPHSQTAKPTTKPTTKATTKPAGEEQQAQLKWVTARKQAVVIRNGEMLTADQIDYDPKSGWISAVGTDRNPAVFYNVVGVPTHSGSSLLWNNKTGDFKAGNLNSRGAAR